MHKITNVNEETQTGCCSVCNLVEVKYRGLKKNGEKRWVCRIRERKSNVNYNKSEKRKRGLWKYLNKTELPKETLERYETATHCDCCGDLRSEKKGRFHIDHDHSTRKVRGFLCANCNVGIGFFKDSVVLLEKAITYIQKPPN